MIKKFIFGIILLICISSIYANSPPELPAIYYGTIESPQTINGVLVAKIDNNVVGSIPIKNNVFGNESSKLLIYSPENINKPISFYLDGNIKLNGSTTYNSGDVRKLTLYYNNNVFDIINVNTSGEIITKNNMNITMLRVKEKIGNINISIPLVNISKNEVINGVNVYSINNSIRICSEIKSIKISDKNSVENIINKIVVENVISKGFEITNVSKEKPELVGNKVMSKITFMAKNTSSKGFTTLLIPIGNLNIDNITINENGKITILNMLNDTNNVNTSLGWYVVENGILEVTLVKDPLVEVSLSAILPTIDNNENNENKDNGRSGSSSHTTTTEYTKKDTTEYNGVAKDIKSEKIKQFVYKAKLIVGSNVDLDLSAKNLKDDSELIKLPTEIKEDCILVGGLVANPLVKKYQFAFKVKVTNNNPGKNKGVIQKQIINGHTVILLAGSDRWGTKAAVEYFKTLEDIPDEPIFVEWKNGKVVKIK